MNNKFSISIVLLALTAVANATTFYVATTGSDSNSGSASSPWRTIQHAANLVNPGDTVVVEDGTYSEVISVTRSGTSSAPIIFKSQNKWGARVAPTGSGIGIVWGVQANYITIQDFEVTGASDTATGIKTFNNRTNNNIVGNKVHDMGWGACVRGAGIEPGSNNSNTNGNWIYKIGLPWSSTPTCPYDHGIYAVGNINHSNIQNNVIFEIFQGYAIHLNDQPSYLNITYNTIFNVGDGSFGGGMVFSCGVNTGSVTCDYVNFSDNIMSNLRMNSYNNGCFGQTAGGYPIIGNFGPNNRFANNVVDSSCPMSTNTWQDGNHDTSTIIANPLYVNYVDDGSGNYHLCGASGIPSGSVCTAKSPAIGVGTSAGAPSTDYDGNPRPGSNGQYDVGAYEFTSSSSSAPAPPSGLTVAVQ